MTERNYNSFFLLPRAARNSVCTLCVVIGWRFFIHSWTYSIVYILLVFAATAGEIVLLLHGSGRGVLKKDPCEVMLFDEKTDDDYD